MNARLAPHRGSVILVLGIIAWVMGNGDLREMDAGRMDPSGRGLTDAGRILGMTNVILSAVGILFYLAVFVGFAASNLHH